jgi:hypothetical protein
MKPHKSHPSSISPHHSHNLPITSYDSSQNAPSHRRTPRLTNQPQSGNPPSISPTKLAQTRLTASPHTRYAACASTPTSAKWTRDPHHCFAIRGNQSVGLSPGGVCVWTGMDKRAPTPPFTPPSTDQRNFTNLTKHNPKTNPNNFILENVRLRKLEL